MKLIFTIGDCNGIGLEVLYKSLLSMSKGKGLPAFEIYIAGNTKTIKEYSSSLNFPIVFHTNELLINNLVCNIIECGEYSNVEFGNLRKSAGLLAAESIEIAVSETLKGNFDAIITLPISKKALYLAGWKYPGHTEMLADRCNIKTPLMILCTNNIRVALVTIHIPIHAVPENISTRAINYQINIFDKTLITDFTIKKPKIAILGLNPHAGEDGSIGKEEMEIIKPAIELSNSKGMNINGPFPADGFFAHNDYKKYDGILAMYHDQGLIPLKLLAKGGGVNFTAGLPIVRTSPDHGTAFHIAGQGIANEKSTLDAIKMAVKIVKSRQTAKVKINSKI